MATRSSTMSTKSAINRSASGDNPGKEKRGTSPSNSHTQRSTVTRSASDSKEKPLSSSSLSSLPASASSTLEKHGPNGLKSTMSLNNSRGGNVKKSGGGGATEDSSANQKILRRRSFDKPPSASPRVQKALISPPARPRDRTAASLLKERTTPARSSSFSGRSTATTSTTSTKPVLARSTTSLSPRPPLDGKSSFAPKAPKAVKAQPVFTSRTTKKSVKTKDSSPSPSSTKTLNQEAKQEDEKELQINNEVAEDTVKVESDIEEVHDNNNDLIPKSENNEEDHDHDDQMIDNKTSEIPTVSEDQNVLNGDAHIEEAEDKSHEEAEIEENPEEIDVVVAAEDDDDDDDDHHHHEETSDQGKAEETSDHHDIIGDENKVEENIAHQDGEEGGGEEELAIAKQEAGNGNSPAGNKWPVGQGKKESPTAYNDVIEETASKLLEKRKNKVKALVGAFETVIDYESAASK